MSINSALSDTLEKRTVTSDKYQKLLNENQSISIISSSEWEGQGKNCADLIAEYSGIQTRKYGGLGSFQSVSMRGMNGSKILVYLDDMPLNSGSGDVVDLGKIDMNTIERIEVYKGIVPAEMGGNGIGGAIRLVSKKGASRASVSINSTIGSHGFNQHSAALKSGIGSRTRVFSQIDYEYSKNDYDYVDRHFTPYNPNDDVVRQRTNSQYQNFNILGNVRRIFSMNNTWEASFLHGNNEGGIPGKEGNLTKTAGFQNNQTMLLLNMNLKTWENKGWDTKAGIGLENDNTRMHWTGEDSLGFVMGNKNADFGSKNYKVAPYLGVSFWPNQALWAELYLFSTAEDLDPVSYHNNEIIQPWHNQRQTMTVSLDCHAALGTWWCVAGFHNEIFRDVSSGGIDPFVPMNNLSPTRYINNYQSGRIGCEWRKSSFLNLFSNVGKYYRYPSLNEKFGGRGGVLPNPFLKPENGLSYEAGCKYALHKNYFEAVGFYLENENAILYLQSGNMLKPANINASRSYGIEATGLMSFAKVFSISLNSTFQNAINSSDIAYYKNKNLPNEPAWSINCKPTIGPFFGFLCQYTIDYKSKLFRDAVNEMEIPAQTLHHVTISKTCNDHLIFRMSVRNLTGIFYEDGYSWFPYPGRQFFFNATLSI